MYVHERGMRLLITVYRVEQHAVSKYGASSIY